MILRANLLIAGSAAVGIGFGVTLAILMVGAWDVSTLKNNEPHEAEKMQSFYQTDSKAWKKTAERRLKKLESKFHTLNRSIGKDNAENGFSLMDDENELSIMNNSFPDPIEDWNRIQSEWQSKLQTHDTESRDNVWAAASEDDLWNSLEELASNVNFKLESIDCRTTTCTAQTSWPSHEAAKLGLGAMLNHDYQKGCGVEIILPEEATEIDSYLATTLIVCENRV